MSKPSSDITQFHSGNGDNVAGDKIVKSAVNARQFYEPISEVLDLSRKRKFEDSFKKLEILEATGSLESCALQLLKVCRIHITLQQNVNKIEITPTSLLELAKSKEMLVKDLATSCLIRLDIKDEKHADAEIRFNSSGESDLNSKETFFELVALENQISDYFYSNQLNLTEQELCGLMRGAIRLKSHSLANDIGSRLIRVSPDINSNILTVIAKISQLNEDLIGKHYWSINSKSKKKLIVLCQLLQDLLEKTDGQDERVVGYASAMADYILGDYKPLTDTLWKFNSAVSQVAPDTSKVLNYVYQELTPEDEHPTNTFSRALKDPAYKNELISTLTQRSTLSSEDSQILIKLGDSSSISKWLESGGQISSDAELERDILHIEMKVLTALAADDVDKSKIRNDINDFLSKHESEVGCLNPVNIVGITDQLISLGLSDSAAQLAKQFVPNADIWLSPITESYLKALLYSDQFMTLAAVLSEIDTDDWDVSTWQIKAQQLANQHKYLDAAEAVREAIKLKPYSPYSWYLLLSYFFANNSDKTIISDAIKEIPIEVFSEPSDYGYWLLQMAAMYSNFELTERIALRWFTESPESNAVQLTNLHFGLAIRKSEKELVVKDEIDNCVGVSFELEGQPHLKLICDGTKPANSHIIDRDSRRGKLLSDMDVGEVVIEGVNEIRLLQKLPPFQAAIQIATEIRTAINDGSDSFHAFQVPSDPDEMFEAVKKKITLANSGTDRLKSLDIPLYMKGARYDKHDPVKAALTLYTDPLAKIPPLPGFGQSQPSKIVIDSYGACYLSLIGAVDALIKSDIELVMTLETKALIQSWIDEVNREDYLTVGINSEGDLFRNTYEDMKFKTSGLQENLSRLASHSNSPALSLVDYPTELSKIADLVDSSVMSSLKMSIANSIPWFCVDLTFGQLAQNNGQDVVDCGHFLSNLLADTSLNLKIDGLHIHLNCQLPYIISLREIIQLANSYEKDANDLLLALLKKYQVPELPLKAAAKFFASLWMLVLFRASDTKDEKVEEIFYQCCNNIRHCDMNQEAEYKVALMLQHCFAEASNINGLVRVVRNFAAKYLSGQFMSFNRTNQHLQALANAYEND